VGLFVSFSYVFRLDGNSDCSAITDYPLGSLIWNGFRGEAHQLFTDTGYIQSCIPQTDQPAFNSGWGSYLAHITVEPGRTPTAATLSPGDRELSECACFHGLNLPL
jgi:hypothetical protein